MGLRLGPLRVVLVWRGEALEERLFARPRVITVGRSRRDTFVVPPSPLGDRFPLFRPSENRARFVLTLAEGMSGKLFIEDAGRPLAVSQFWHSGRGVPDGPFRQQPLAPGDWGIVGLDDSGDVAFFFQFVARGLKIGRRRSWLGRVLGPPPATATSSPSSP
jgi:hypothetical protein